MSFQVCSCCRQSFPSSLIQAASFSEEISVVFTAVFDSFSKIEGKTEKDCNELQKLKLRMQNLCGKVDEEVAQLRGKIAQNEELLSYRPRDISLAEGAVSARGALGSSVGGGGRRNMADWSFSNTHPKQSLIGSSSSLALQQRSSFLPPVPGGGAATINMNNNSTFANRSYGGAEGASTARTLFGGAVPPNRLKKMTTAFELVSASLYSVLESLAIQTRVDTALLWIKPKGAVSVELVAPFVVGRNLSKIINSAPYRVPETSVPCAVSTTGIAVNMKPRTNPDGTMLRTTAKSEDLSITELMEKTNAAQLLVPVFARYESCTKVQKRVIAVIHLIGSPRYPFPFNRRNESAAMQASAFFSTILSTHQEVMVGEWVNHFFDPSVVVGTSTYRGELDLRGDEKSDDDFAQPPTLIYRCVNDRQADDDPREAHKALRSAILHRAVPPEPVNTIKDLYRHAANMESNWASAVENTTRLETMVGTLQEGALLTEVRQLKDKREELLHTEASRNGTRTSWAQLSLGTAGASGSRPPTGKSRPIHSASSMSSVNTADIELTELKPEKVIVNDSNNRGMEMDVLKPEQVDALEYVSLKRLRNLGVDPTPFLSADMAELFM